nr:protein FAM50A-like [Nicotiana tomentosiformis]
MEKEYMKTFQEKSNKLNPQNSQDALLKFEQLLSGIQPEEFQDDEESDGEGDDEFDDPDYNLSESDEDFEGVISDHPSKNERGRPKKSKHNVPTTSGIVVQEINENSNSDVDEEEELHERNSDIEEEEDKVTFGEYDEAKRKENPSLELGTKFRSLEQFKDACRNWGIKNRRQLHFPTNDTERVIC